MTITELKDKGLIIYECLSGSHAYGLATEHSDEDIKGVFVLPEEEYFGLDYVDQVSDESNDIVYYELRRFVELLTKSNPGALEMLYSPDDTILHIHSAFEPLRKLQLLSKKCQDTFGGYAATQVRKAKGLKKKIVNPVEKERKGVLDFCFVAAGQGAIPVGDYLKAHNMEASNCGLAKISHMHDVYGLYYGNNTFKGIVQSNDSNDVTLSSVPKGMQPLAYMSFNKSGYSAYCKEYKDYWHWVEKRNDQRYQNTLDHGKNYDAKNMLHTFRLLQMCKEIGETSQLKVRRDDRDFLLRVKQGEFEYHDLLTQAKGIIEALPACYSMSELPSEPDRKMLNHILVKTRKLFYKK
ncbi:nucleotidyltransferase domain-containing protein [Fulvivirga sediminis]|uniref:Nucleotidyltransferase domain-containing protein n=1 Tax=Fulvivirga sediminis TaxID=2803949 RepID=A0A937F3H1_9BACT|nr:nucleotidyltransferase domain-containing protein [Fulvivirga sediminis]MBL3655656.1 nucleotidyltransferase domain-containing protein [Fulvivirga sediminis]